MKRKDLGQPMSVYVRICDPQHPHYPETGYLTGEIIQMKFGDQRRMAKMKLENCKHGTDACYVEKGQVAAADEASR